MYKKYTVSAYKDIFDILPLTFRLIRLTFSTDIFRYSAISSRGTPWLRISNSAFSLPTKLQYSLKRSSSGFVKADINIYKTSSLVS